MSRINNGYKPQNPGRPPERDRRRRRNAAAQKIIKPPEADQTPRDGKLLAVLDEKMLSYKAYQMLIDGYTMPEIVEALNTNENSLNQAMIRAVNQLDTETAILRMNWQKVWVARTEYLVNTLLKELREGTRKLDRDFKDILKGVFDMQSMAMDTGPKTQMTQNNTFIQTVEPNSELWMRGQARLQMAYSGKTMPGLEQYVAPAEVGELDGLLDDD